MSLYNLYLSSLLKNHVFLVSIFTKVRVCTGTVPVYLSCTVQKVYLAHCSVGTSFICYVTVTLDGIALSNRGLSFIAYLQASKLVVYNLGKIDCNCKKHVGI